MRELIQVDIDDELRVNIARELKDRIEKIVQQQKLVEVYSENSLNDERLIQLS